MLSILALFASSAFVFPSVLSASFKSSSTTLPSSSPFNYSGIPSGAYSTEWQSYFQVTEKLPNVTFSTGGNSYAGNIGVNRAGHPDNSLFFWGFEKSTGSFTATGSSEPWAIWLNGGPGSSSMVGLHFENGPLHINNNYSVTSNPYSWHQIADYFWIDQPVGTGYSTCDVDGYVQDEFDVAADFWGFVSNLLLVFPGLATRPLYLTGESFAGTYIPYIVQHYFSTPNPPVKIAKIVIGDGLLGSPNIFEFMGVVSMIETYPQIIGYDPLVYEYFNEQSSLCGYNLDLQYPGNGPLPALSFTSVAKQEREAAEAAGAAKAAAAAENAESDPHASDTTASHKGRSLFSHNHRRHQRRSPATTPYHQTRALSTFSRAQRFTDTISDRYFNERSVDQPLMPRSLVGRPNGTLDPYYGCDLLQELEDYAVNFTFPWTLGENTFDTFNVVDALDPLAPMDASVFLNDPEVVKAIHAPQDKVWVRDFDYPFGANGIDDPSPEPINFLNALATNMSNAGIPMVMYSGNNDAVVPHRATALTIQNTTFGGIQGFSQPPSTPWTDSQGKYAGVIQQERNWTLALFLDAGHFVPYFQPSAAYTFAEQFIFGNNQTGFLADPKLPNNVVGGVHSSLQDFIFPGTDGIYYGHAATMSTYYFPAATVKAWNSFIATAASGVVPTVTFVPGNGKNGAAARGVGWSGIVLTLVAGVISMAWL